MSEPRAALPRALLGLRLSVFLVMLMWTLDKFLRPEHAAEVYEAFYLLPGAGQWGMRAAGAAELLLLAACWALYALREEDVVLSADASLAPDRTRQPWGARRGLHGGLSPVSCREPW